MKFSDLDFNLQKVIEAVTGQKQSTIETTFLSVEQHHYNQIFWQLHNNPNIARDEFGKPASAKQAAALVHQLNQYIIANTRTVTKKYKLKNPVLITRPKPPLRQQYSQYLPQIDRLDQQLMKDPDFGYPVKSLNKGAAVNAKFYLGQLLYTAARFGGLLQVKLLESLLQLLSKSEPTKYKDIVWFNLQAEIDYPWLPDPVSSALLPRYYRLREQNNWVHEPAFQHFKWLQCLKTFLQHSGCDQLSKLRANQFIRAIKARLSITHTPCHLNVATGEEPNVPLTINAFTRLLGRYSATEITDETLQSEIEEHDEVPSVQASLASAASSSHAHLHQAITDCRVVIKQVKRELLSFGESSSQNASAGTGTSLAVLSHKLLAISKSSDYVLLPVTKLLIEWAAMRLTSQNKWSGKLKPNSIVTYLNHIFAPMTRAFAGHDLITAATDHAPESTTDIDEYYLEIIDEARSQRSRLMRAKILRDFHLFLEKKYFVKPSYVSSTIIMQGSKDMASTVDANILLPQEYQTACKVLFDRAEKSSLPERDYIPLILLILGFRCGLRRREALFLRMTDLQTPGEDSHNISSLTELLVRPHIARKLKSHAAERRLPLGKLLSEREIKWFNHYLALRQQHEENIFLFYDAKTNKPVDEDAVFIPLVHQLKHITQDPGFRYHRLRHSFVSWTFWYWQKHKYPNDHPLKELLDHKVMQHLADARKHYFHQASNTAIRGELHAVSTMAGHSSPSMTLLHYLHAMHWCQSAESWRDYSLHQDAIAKLLAIPRRTFFDQKEKLGLIPQLSQAIAPWCSTLPEETYVALATNAEAAKSATQFKINEIREFYRVLYKFHLEAKLFQPLTAEDFNDDNEAWIDDSQTITPDSLRKSAMEQHNWAEEQLVNPEQFVHAINLLIARLTKDNRAIRQQKNRFTGSTYSSKTARYELPFWSGKGYASKTATLLLNAFNALTEAEQADALQVANYIVMDKVISWNNCQFRQPEDLWRFVSQMEPLIKKMPARYFINIDMLNQFELDSPQRNKLVQDWQAPRSFEIKVHLKHVEYSDAKGDGYASLTLRTSSVNHGENRQGDHGFYLGMTAIYFYFASLSQQCQSSKAVAEENSDTKSNLPAPFEAAPEPDNETAPPTQDDDAISPIKEGILSHNSWETGLDDNGDMVLPDHMYQPEKEIDTEGNNYCLPDEISTDEPPSLEKRRRKRNKEQIPDDIPDDNGN